MNRKIPFLKSKKNIVWDFDGTIANLEVDWKSLKKEIYKTSDIISFFRLLPLNLSIKLLNLEKREKVIMIIKKYEIESSYSPIDNVIKFIEHNKTKFSHFLLTDNTKDSVIKILNELNLLNYFIDIIAKEDVKKYKPSNEGLKILFLKHKSLNKDNTIVIGDSWKDHFLSIRSGIGFLNVKRLL